jgi:hypothetical protein
MSLYVNNPASQPPWVSLETFEALQEKTEVQETQIKTLTDEITTLKALFKNALNLQKVPEDDEAMQCLEGDVADLNEFADAEEDDIAVPNAAEPHPAEDAVPPVANEAADVTIGEATIQVLDELNIDSKDKFNEWKDNDGLRKRKEGQQVFYDMVKNISQTHWATLSPPRPEGMEPEGMVRNVRAEAKVRFTYQAKLSGFALSQQ